jgi:inorganic triphosphatase YgiF
MAPMAGSRKQEIERKYAVGPDAVLPDLAEVAGVGGVRPVEHHLEAVYFDTEDFDLVGARVTLRRRTGGSDAGWHLKEPGTSAQARAETHLPVASSTDEVPASLVEEVAPVTGGRPLRPVARVTTLRREHVLVGGDGAELAQVCDDEVDAERLVVPRRRRAWREWEVELAGAPPEFLDVVEAHLRAAGAVPSAAPSKLVQALGADAG